LSRRPFDPGAWGEADFRRRANRYPVVAVKHEPVAPHTRWHGAGVCNSSCRCGVMVGIVTSHVPGQTSCLEPFPSDDGAFVLELSEHRTSLAVPYDPEIHAGWTRYAEHVCRPKTSEAKR
jgi:hypothetical protein